MQQRCSKDAAIFVIDRQAIREGARGTLARVLVVRRHLLVVEGEDAAVHLEPTSSPPLLWGLRKPQPGGQTRPVFRPRPTFQGKSHSMSHFQVVSFRTCLTKSLYTSTKECGRWLGCSSLQQRLTSRASYSRPGELHLIHIQLYMQLISSLRTGWNKRLATWLGQVRKGKTFAVRRQLQFPHAKSGKNAMPDTSGVQEGTEWLS
ncbi:hypothetical protein B0T17DRAFT_299838 [Bombardia bombarda]|uniref:Uncharacterized protein n=1 Tax=Bombardia bombarda TaxID=252184 RepID=A0AA39WU86_9PEZI|nr:hypothetical protein B0T17DRAFT_299838 [Bombardia bombarda]